MRKAPRFRWRVRWRDESGNASVEFALVAPLLMLVALAVLQLMLAIHVRTVITSAAIEGARVGALVGSDLQTAEERTREVLTGNIAGAAVSNITATNRRNTANAAAARCFHGNFMRCASLEC